MSNRSPSYYRRRGYDAFVPGEECRSKNPDTVEGWNQAKKDWEEQQQINVEYEEVCKLYSAENVSDLKVWLEYYVLPKVLEDRGL